MCAHGLFGLSLGQAYFGLEIGLNYMLEGLQLNGNVHRPGVYLLARHDERARSNTFNTSKGAVSAVACAAH